MNKIALYKMAGSDIDHKKRSYRHNGEVWEVFHEGVNAMVEIRIPKNEKIRTEHGVVIAMSDTCEIELATNWRGFFSQQSFIQQHVVSTGDNDWVFLSPDSYGDIVVFNLKQYGPLNIMKHNYLASSENVDLNIELQADVPKILFSGGLFIMRARGEGMVAVHASGGIDKIDVTPGKPVKVDNGNIVAWSAGVQYELVRATRSLFASAVSSEGLFARFTGRGCVYISTRLPIESIIRREVASRK